MSLVQKVYYFVSKKFLTFCEKKVDFKFEKIWTQENLKKSKLGSPFGFTISAAQAIRPYFTKFANPIPTKFKLPYVDQPN
jgi:hypothetical protein